MNKEIFVSHSTNEQECKNLSKTRMMFLPPLHKLWTILHHILWQTFVVVSLFNSFTVIL